MKNQEVTFPAVREEPVAWGSGDLHAANDYKAIVNPGSCFPLSPSTMNSYGMNRPLKRLKRRLPRPLRLGSVRSPRSFTMLGAECVGNTPFPQ
jgi:hypothetical protein